jgi:hypothetical protein
MYLNYNQNTARTTCAAYGMQLYRFTLPDDEPKLMEYANSQFMFNRFWVEGGDGTNGVMVSNQNQTTFTKINVPASTLNYFFCEYQGKLKNECLNVIVFALLLLLVAFPKLLTTLEPQEGTFELCGDINNRLIHFNTTFSAFTLFPD